MPRPICTLAFRGHQDQCFGVKLLFQQPWYEALRARDKALVDSLHTGMNMYRDGPYWWRQVLELSQLPYTEVDPHVWSVPLTPQFMRRVLPLFTLTTAVAGRRLRFDSYCCLDVRRARVLIGSCPRSPADVDRLVDEAGVEAIVCLQCSLCHEAMEIDWQAVRRRAIERGVMIVQVSVRDFDRLDQAKMLPEAVRKLAAFQAMGKRTYVHCPAGINRASLTVVGYLTFVKQFDLEAALDAVRTSRPQANPYVVSWEIARARLLANKTEDIYLYSQVSAGGNSMGEGGDWIKRDIDRAEKGVIAETFRRAVDADLSMYGALLEMGR